MPLTPWLAEDFRRKQASAQLPQIGDFIRRDAHDGRCGAIVARKTSARYDDIERVSHCETDDGARRLAALMNQARDLARDWRSLSTLVHGDTDGKAWALFKIVHAVALAIGAPAPEFRPVTIDASTPEDIATSAAVSRP